MTEPKNIAGPKDLLKSKLADEEERLAEVRRKITHLEDQQASADREVDLTDKLNEMAVGQAPENLPIAPEEHSRQEDIKMWEVYTGIKIVTPEFLDSLNEVLQKFFKAKQYINSNKFEEARKVKHGLSGDIQKLIRSDWLEKPNFSEKWQKQIKHILAELVSLAGEIAIKESEVKTAVIKQRFKDSSPETVRVSKKESAADAKAEAIRKLREIIEDIIEENKEIEIELASIRAEKRAKKEELGWLKTFSTNFIESKIAELLRSSSSIEEIKNIKITGGGNELSLEIKVAAQGKVIGITATIESEKGALKAKNLEINAGTLVKMFVKKLITPKLNQIEEILKKEVEKQEGKKVTKIEIEDGLLIATF
ncbi:MAG: hypothetical protein WD991_01805 [Candidatus Paceibacterota bacterium]